MQRYPRLHNVRFGHVYLREERHGDFHSPVMSNPYFSPWDTNNCCCNSSFVVVADGRNELLVADAKTGAQLHTLIPLHPQGRVVDFQFSPFNEGLLACSTSDGSVRVWSIPSFPRAVAGLTQPVQEHREPIGELSGHTRKVGNLTFHPTCDNVLVSLSVDSTARIWDLERLASRMTIHCQEMKGSFRGRQVFMKWSWDDSGTTAAAVVRSKSLFLVDPRAPSPERCVGRRDNITGSMKGIRCQFLNDRVDSRLILVSGFDRPSRVLKLVDTRNLKDDIAKREMDLSPCIPIPFYDPELGLLYVGDQRGGVVRIFDLTKGSLRSSLTPWQQRTPIMGMAMLPKTSNDVNRCHLAGFYIVTREKITLVNSVFPRKSSQFYGDLFPPTRVNWVPNGGADAFFFGCRMYPLKKVSLHPAHRLLVPPRRHGEGQLDVVRREMMEERLKFLLELLLSLVGLYVIRPALRCALRVPPGFIVPL